MVLKKKNFNVEARIVSGIDGREVWRKFLNVGCGSRELARQLARQYIHDHVVEDDPRIDPRVEILEVVELY